MSTDPFNSTQTVANSTVDHATQTLSHICGDRCHTVCKIIMTVGSMAANVFVSIFSGIISIVATFVWVLAKIIVKLICIGELKTTCDAVASLGSNANDMARYICKCTLAFIRDKFIPGFWQAIDVSREFTRVHITPVILQLVDLVREKMYEVLKSVCDTSIIYKQQLAYWLRLRVNRSSGFPGLDDFKALNVTNLANRFPDPHQLLNGIRAVELDFDRAILPAAALIIFVAIIIKSSRAEHKPRRNTMTRRNSDRQSQSGFLQWDDDLDDEDDRHQLFAGSHYSLTRSFGDEYPALSVDGDGDATGRSPVLPLMKGPSATTLTFFAYAPPSIDKEIPKIDVVGTLQFVKTGKVRTFVHKGSRRLLVVNFQDMTVELYLPKPSGASVQTKAHKPKSESAKTRLRQSGIHLKSTRNLADDDSDDEEENVKMWDRKNFMPRPEFVIMLSQLISVSALPKSNSLLEITYRSPTSKTKKVQSNSRKESSGSMNNANHDNSTLDEAATLVDDSSCGADSLGFDEVKSHCTRKLEERRSEFAFLTSNDAAEFQRLVMALRTSGQGMSHLYELLEELHVNTEAHFPEEMLHSNENTKRCKETEDEKKLPKFCPPGLALDDAWRCMNEIPILCEGLLQYHQHSYLKFTSKYNDLIATAAAEKEASADDETNERKKIAQFYRTKRSLIGIVDFISLFVNPLPLKATPYMTPSGAKDVINGINAHHQRLEGTLLLEELVSKATIYVVAYYRAKVVVQDGWRLLPQKQDTSPDDSTQNTEDSDAETQEVKVDSENNEVDLKRLAFDNDRDNWAYDMGHQNAVYEASVGKDVSVLMQGNTSLYQAFTLVGIHAFKLPHTNWSDTNLGEDTWLDPKIDPVDYLPSLRAVMEKYKDRMFIVVFYFNKKTATAVGHLFVRSLPVGVDSEFDESLSNFIAATPEKRNDCFQVASQFAFDQGWSTVTRLVVRTILCTLFSWIFGHRTVVLNKGLRERLSCPAVLVRHFAKVRYFPDQRGSVAHALKNYISVTLQDNGGGIKNMLFRRLAANKQSIDQGLVYDYSFAIKDNSCKRVLTTTRIVHLDTKSVAMPKEFRDEQSENDSEFAGVSNLAALMSAKIWSKHTRRRKPLSDISSNDEMYSKEIDAVFEILDGVCVPTRSINSEAESVIHNELVRLHLSRTDIERYLIACACDMQAAAVRIIESCAWRGHIFPIDRRRCRIELRSGQLFQQGFDKENHPIFYFRHWLLGPWRNDVEASILAALYRLETYFQRMALLKPGVKCTAIILMGNSGIRKRDSAIDSADGNAYQAESDPMMDSNLEYTAHGSIDMFIRLIGCLRRHYPERLSKALIISRGKRSRGKIREFISAQQITTPRVIVLSNVSELKKYVDENQLVTFAGGKASVASDAFKEM